MSIEVKDLSFSYGDHSVLRSVSFGAEYGEFLSILGPNGVGKSTLMRCMLGLLTPSGGQTRIDGRDVAGMSSAELSGSIAYIPQSHSPVFNYTVSDVVLMGTTAQMGRFSSPGKAQREQAAELLDRLQIADLRDRGYRSISGGERQLVLIARAMAQQARILLMDEPSSSLDFGNRVRVMETVRGLTEQGYCVIQSTHDPDQAYRVSDRILAMYGGEVLAWGTPQETIRDDVMSTLYGIDTRVCSLWEDRIRVCIPASEKTQMEEST